MFRQGNDGSITVHLVELVGVEEHDVEHTPVPHVPPERRGRRPVHHRHPDHVEELQEQQRRCHDAAVAQRAAEHEQMPNRPDPKHVARETIPFRLRKRKERKKKEARLGHAPSMEGWEASCHGGLELGLGLGLGFGLG